MLSALLLVGLALRQGPPAAAAALAAASGAPPPPPLRLVLDPASPPAFRSGAAFFTAAPNGFNNNLTLVPPLLSDLRREPRPLRLGHRRALPGLGQLPSQRLVLRRQLLLHASRRLQPVAGRAQHLGHALLRRSALLRRPRLHLGQPLLQLRRHPLVGGPLLWAVPQ